MNRTKQFAIIALSLITMLLSSVLLPQTLFAQKADESKGKETLVEYSGSEEDLKVFLQELKGMAVTVNEDPANDLLQAPADESWSSATVSPQQLAQLVTQQLIGPCVTVRFRVRIPTPWGPIVRTVVVHICLE